MATFPPVRSLIGFPYSGASVTLLTGESYSPTYYPLSRLTDGSPRLAWRSVYDRVALRFDLGADRPVNFVGIIGHNIAPDTLITVWASTGSPPPDLPAYPDDEGAWATAPQLIFGRTFGVEYPNCWVDTRDALGTATTARYWQVHINNSSGRPIAINEVVIGEATAFEGILKKPFTEKLFAFQERQILEYGKVAISGAGTMARTVELDLRVTPEEHALLDTIWDEATLGPLDGSRVVVIPDSRRNDIWYVQWPTRRETTYEQSYRVGSIPLTIAEEAFGAV